MRRHHCFLFFTGSARPANANTRARAGTRLRTVYSDEDLLDYVKNIYRVLLTRGIRGTFVYVVDPHLREYLRPFFSVTA
jgi:DUF2075 family protein